MFERQETGIVVNVIDVSSVYARAIMRYRRGGIELRAGYRRYGYVFRARKIFALNDWGVGPAKPVGPKHKLSLPLWEQIAGPKEPIFPRFLIELNDAELLSLPVIERIDLRDFIQNGGRSAQLNFLEWEETLNDLDKATAESGCHMG